MYFGIIIFLVGSLAQYTFASCVLSTARSGDASTESDTELPCLTKKCVFTAASVLKNMDSSVDPCDDFYHFACGNYIKSTAIPDDKSTVNAFVDIADKVKVQLKLAFEKESKPEDIKPFKLLRLFYAMCLDTEQREKDGLDTIKGILEDAVGWPVLEGKAWDESTFDIFEANRRFRIAGLPYDSFLTTYVGTDLKNSSRRMIMIDEGALSIDREHLIKGWDGKVVESYYKYLVDIALLFGADKEEANKQLRESVDFEIALSKITLPKEEQRNISNLYNPMTIEELESNFQFIPWLEYLKSILNNDSLKISEDEEVSVTVPKYFTNLEALLNNTTKRAQANYMVANVLGSISSYLTEEIKNKDLKLEAVVYGTKQREPKWKECLKNTLDSFRQASSALYVRNYFNSKSKSVATELVDDVKDAFIGMLNDLDWMDETTKALALQKASVVNAHVGYPQELLDDQILKDYYSELQVENEDNFLELYLKLEKFRKDKLIGRLREIVNRTDWRDHSSSTDVNAYYDFSENSLQLPAGILQGVFFEYDRPHYMNYGSMGFVIGHEITHGFDDMGRQFDDNGNLFDWWEEHTQTEFVKKAQCIIDQFDNYTIPKLNLHLNGIITQGENIADSGGIKEAYIAYKKWLAKTGSVEKQLPGLNYTPNQMFWISTANLWCAKLREEYLKQIVLTDAHSPSEFRILGGLSNCKYFAQDFNCPVGSRMNPEKKCQVW